MPRRFPSFLLLAFVMALLLSLPGQAGASLGDTQLPDGATALIAVAIDSPDDLERFGATGLPAYTRLQGRQSTILLAGAGADGLQSLAQAGLSARVLDADLAGASYYLASAPAGREQPDWGIYGRVLLEADGQVLLRAPASQAEQLTAGGAEIRRLSLDAKPLSPMPAGSFPAVIEPDPLIQSMIDQVDSDTVYSYTGGLSGEWPVRVGGEDYTITSRYTYSGASIQKATQYVGEHMQALGLNVEYHQWGGSTYPNVIGELPGVLNPDEIYIIGGHLDDVSGAPGADDNGSGSVATMIAADIFTQYQWGCTLRFAFWTGEEQGLLGSYEYAQRAYGLGENILGYLNLDMIAWNTLNSSPGIDLYHDTSIPPSLDLANLFADVVDAYNLDLIPQITTGEGGSDHASFLDFGYTAILGIEDEGDFNPYYHGPGDNIDHIDLGYYTEFVKAAIGTTAHMSNCLIPSGLGYLDGHVAAQDGGAPIAGASLAAQNSAGYTFSATTDASGYYTRTLVADTYTVTASAYGFLPGTLAGVEVLTDTLTTADFSLATAPAYTISGTVTEEGSGLPLFASVEFIGSPLTVWTDPASGFYQADLPQGEYTMQVRAYAHHPLQRDIVVDQDQTQDFSLAANACILLVDDDQDDPDVRAYYTEVLDDLGVDYDIWDTQASGDPPSEDLEGYQQVYWFIGYPWSDTFNASNEAAVSTYLDAGGNFFLSSQDYLWDMSLTDFGRDYLHIGNYVNDEYHTSVEGENLYAGLGPYPLTYPFTNYSDIVNPDGQSVLAFLGNLGNAAISYDGDFKTVFLGFPLEAVSLSGRTEVLSTTLDHFGGCALLPGTLTGQVSDAGDGAPIEGAQVTVTPGGLQQLTDPMGVYTFSLPAGAYSLTVYADYYLPATGEAVVEAGGTTSVDFALQPLPAAISVEPGSFSEVLLSGETSTSTLTIGNIGEGLLQFSTPDPEAGWFNLEPTSAELLPMESVSIEVAFDAGLLAEGIYTTTLTVASNDPLNPLVTVPVQLEVLPLCDPVGEADFSWVPLEPVTGETVAFSAVQSGTPPFTYTWEINGTVIEGAEAELNYVFESPGVYEVKLTVMNACSQVAVTHTVEVGPAEQEWILFLPLVVR